MVNLGLYWYRKRKQMDREGGKMWFDVVWCQKVKRPQSEECICAAAEK